MVQRYDLIVDDLRQMGECEDGYFVSYEDYARLNERARMLAAEVDKFLRGERAYLDEAMSQYLAEDEDE